MILSEYRIKNKTKQNCVHWHVGAKSLCYMSVCRQVDATEYMSRSDDNLAWLSLTSPFYSLLSVTTTDTQGCCHLRSAGITDTWCCCLALCRLWGSQFKTLPRIGKPLIHGATSPAQNHTISCGFNFKGVLRVVDGPGSVGTARFLLFKM